MDTLRIFISSPGDVAEERERARQVVQGLRRRYARHFELVPVVWEEMPLGVDASFQEGIDLLLSKDRGVDIAVFILWSRLGSALGSRFTRTDGRAYRSGTERELDMMLQAREAQDGQRPHILAYARQDEATFEEQLRGRSTTEKGELLRQKELVEGFIREEFHDEATGTNLRAYHTYQRPQTFGERLRAHLEEILDGMTAGRAGRPSWNIDELGPPFLGLESFAFEHAEVFFGREDEVSEARLRLAAAAKRGTAFLLVSGGSGTGKSSLAAAGILPEIVAHETDESVGRWLHARFTPAALGGDPALGLARILFAAVPGLAGRADVGDLAKAFAMDPALGVSIVLHPALKAEAGSGSAVRLALLVDQLEEVFTDARLTDAARDRFAAILEALASGGQVWIVATIRSDYYARLLECEGLRRLKTEGTQLDLGPPGADALRRMIESPALLSGLSYEQTGETTLADRILRDVSGQAELLPLLEDMLRELFERRSPEGVLTVAAYESLGGIEGSLAKRAEASLTKLPADVQLAFADVMRQLVASGDGPEGSAVRRRALLQSFAAGSPARALVDALVADRLATASAGEDGQPEVSIAHEAILRVWPRAAAWIRENGEFLRLRDRLATRMLEKAPLTAGDPLVPAARAILESKREAFEPELAAYVERQITAIDADRARRERVRRIVVTGLSALSIAATITAGAALWQWREASRQSTTAKRQLYVANLYRLQNALDRPQRTLANQLFQETSASYRDGYGEKAVDPIELRSLRTSLDQAIHVLEGHLNEVDFVAFSPDGTRLVTGSSDETMLRDAATGKELAKIKGESPRSSVAFSPDGKRLATGSYGGTAQLWDVATGKELAKLEGHLRWVNFVVFSPDGSRLVTAGTQDKTARLWDVATGKELAVLEGHEGAVTSAAFSPDGKRLATSSDDESARLWDVGTGNEIAKLAHRNRVYVVAFSPDGTRLATTSFSGIVLWNAETAKELFQLGDQSIFARSLAFSPDGTRMATASADNTARLWDAATGKELAVMKGHQGEVTAVAFSPDGTRMATASDDNTARLWDVATGKGIGQLKGHQGPVKAVAFSPDGTRLVTGSGDKTARLWDTATEEKPGDVDVEGTSVAFSPDGTRLAIGSGFNLGWGSKEVRLRDVATGNELAKLEAIPVLGCSVAFSPDGTRLATGFWHRNSFRRISDGVAIWDIAIWDIATGRQLAKLEGHDEDWVTCLAFSPDGMRLATGYKKNSARLWDAATGQELAVLEGHEDEVNSIAFSPDGKRLATASSDNTARLWDTETAKEIVQLKGHKISIESISFSPDGKRLATGSLDNTARLWDAATGKKLTVLTGHESEVRSVVFSPDGTRLATGSDDKTARLWDVSTGKEMAVLNGHESEVVSVVFSPDGTRLATTGANDKTARLWDATTGKELVELKGHESAVTAIAFSPDGSRLVTRGNDGTLRLWGITNAEIDANQRSAKATQERLKPIVEAWFLGDGADATVEAKLGAAKASMPAADWHEAANLVLMRSMSMRRASEIRSRFLDGDDGLARFTEETRRHDNDADELYRLAQGIPDALKEGFEVSPGLVAAAVEAARRSVELQPSARNLDVLAFLFGRQGHFDEAISTLRRAIELMPEDQRSEAEEYLQGLEAKAEAARAAEPAPQETPAAPNEPAP